MAEIADYTAEQIMDAIAMAMKAGDMEAAAAMLCALAVKDPDSAQIISTAIDARALYG